jgi:hypothetical protein
MIDENILSELDNVNVSKVGIKHIFAFELQNNTELVWYDRRKRPSSKK